MQPDREDKFAQIQLEIIDVLNFLGAISPEVLVPSQ